MDETQILMAMLVLIDKALVASLIVMVMLSSYENFVGRFDAGIREDSPTWLGRLDPGSLKIKVAATIVAISSINLLQSFLTATEPERPRDHVEDDHALRLPRLGAGAWPCSTGSRRAKPKAYKA